MHYKYLCEACDYEFYPNWFSRNKTREQCPSCNSKDLTRIEIQTEEIQTKARSLARYSGG